MEITFPKVAFVQKPHPHSPQSVPEPNTDEWLPYPRAHQVPEVPSPEPSHLIQRHPILGILSS